MPIYVLKRNFRGTFVEPKCAEHTPTIEECPLNVIKGSIEVFAFVYAFTSLNHRINVRLRGQKQGHTNSKLSCLQMSREYDQI